MAELPIRLYQSKSGAAVQTVYRHILIAGFDERGRQMWEMNGLATDARSGGRQAFGIPFDRGDRIEFWMDTPTYFWANSQNHVRLFTGSPKEISRLRLQAMEAGSKINKADLHYRAWLNPQNSNSVAATLLKAMGKDPKEILLGMRLLYENGTFAGGFPNYKGFEHDLLPGHIPSPTVDPTEVPRPLPRPAEEGFRNLPLPRTRPSDVGSQGSENVGIVSGNGLLQNYQSKSEIGDTELPLNGIFSDFVGHRNDINFAPDISSHIRTDNVVAVPVGATELAEFLPGVSSALKRRSKMISAQLETRTNNDNRPLFRQLRAHDQS